MGSERRTQKVGQRGVPRVLDIHVFELVLFIQIQFLISNLLRNLHFYFCMLVRNEKLRTKGLVFCLFVLQKIWAQIFK